MATGRSAASVERLRKRLAKVPLEVRAAAATEALLQAQALGAAIQRAAPKDEGKLKESVRVEGDRTGERFLVKAGGPLTTRPVRKGASATYDYANAVEHGTQKMKREPFFYPTYRARRAQIRRAIVNAAARAAKLTGDA